MPGEHRFIAGLVRRLPESSQKLIGDDAALVDGRLVTTDVLVEGVDFRAAWGTPADLGWKALAVNASDIAAMGGTPTAAVVAIVLGDHDAAFWDGVYDGIADAALRLTVQVVGGDVSSGPVASITVTMLGTPGERVVTRSGARAGDVLCVGGALGAAAAGLAALEGRRPRSAALEARFLRPEPQLKEGAEAARMGATAMIDVSDGLSNDALNIASASQVGMEIEEALIPLASGVDDVALALSGGEDFVLCLTFPPGVEPPAWATRVGRVLPLREGSRLVRSDGETTALEATGWDHLAR